MSGPLYKFVELSVVTDQSIEDTVNEWVGRGWSLDGIRFVTTDASRRPQMAFVSFVRDQAHAHQANHEANHEANREANHEANHEANREAHPE